MRFLQGTYGVDLLSIVLILFGLLFNQWHLTSVFGVVFLILGFARALSKDIFKRKQELNKFYQIINKPLARFGKTLPNNFQIIDLNNISYFFDILISNFKEKRKYKITKCPNCKQKLRLPRGKGKLIVTCKKCSTKFDLKT